MSLSRWVQDPEQQKKKKENAILDSLRVVSVALTVNTNTAKVLKALLHYSLATLKYSLNTIVFFD